MDGDRAHVVEAIPDASEANVAHDLRQRLGVGPLAAVPTRQTVKLAGLCGLAAFLVDVYLY